MSGSIEEIIAQIRGALGLDDGRHARHNLDGAIIDADHGNFDEVCIRTMRRVRDQIGLVEDILDAADAPNPPAHEWEGLGPK
jgi:hypothetical protein